MLFARVSSQEDPVIAREARVYSHQESGATAGLLACLAVFDERKAFRALGFPTMLEYCQRDLCMSEDCAKKYLGAARTARDYPVIFDMIADRRLSVSAVLMLRKWLQPHSADELLAAVAGKSREAIDWLLAERFPRSDVLMLEAGQLQAVNVQELSPSSAPGHPAPLDFVDTSDSTVPVAVSAKLTPLSTDRVSLQLSMSRATREKLRRAQELLGHEVASDDVAAVLDRALDQLIVVLEKRKHGLGRRRRAVKVVSRCDLGAGHAEMSVARVDRSAPQRDARATPAVHSARPAPRPVIRKPGRARYIPGHVRADVYRRDQGHCTFVGESGERCGSRHALEYDHITPLADGGPTTTANLRLLCPAHNQLEAERRFGAGFMQGKRAARARALKIHDDSEPIKFPHEGDLHAALAQLGCRPAHMGAALVAAGMLPAETGLEPRLRAALKACKPGNAVTIRPMRPSEGITPTP